MSFSIEYIYKIVDQFSSKMNAMAAAGAKFNTRISGIQSRLGTFQNKLRSAGAGLANMQTGLMMLGTGMVLKESMADALEFNKAMNMTAAVVKDVAIGSKEFNIMRERAMEWGSSTQFTSIQVAQAFAELGKKGRSMNEIIALMPGVMNLAAAGEIEMAEAANYAMGIVNQFGLQVSDAGMIADLMAAAASNSATTVTGMASAMNNTGIQAKLAGVSVQDTTSALMAMADRQLEGAAAGTMLMNALRAITVMPLKLQKGFNRLGIDINQFRDVTSGQITDFFGLIQAMQNAGVTAAQLGGMFDIRAMKAMSILVSTNSAELEKYRGIVAESSGTSQEMAETLLAGPVGVMVRFQSVMGNLKVVIGEFVAKTLTPLIEKFTAFLSNLQKNNPQLLKFITNFMIGITAITGILIPLGIFLSLLSSIAGAIKIVIGVTKLWGIATAFLTGLFKAKAVTLALTKIQIIAYTIGTKIAAVATKIWSVVQAVFNAILSANPIALVIIGIAALIAIIIIVIKYWKQIVAALKLAWEWMVKVYDMIKGVLFLFGGPFVTAAIAVIEIIRSVVESWKSIVEAFKGKGILAGILQIGKAILAGLLAPIESFLNLVSKIPGVGKLAAGAAGKIHELRMGLQGIEEAEKMAVKPVAERIPYETTQIPVTQPQPQPAKVEASISVYKERGITVVPYKKGNNLGYQM